MFRKFCIVLIIVGCVSLLSLALAQEAAQTPAMPGRVPMYSYLLQPSAEWNAYYDVVPEGERRLYWTSRAVLDNARETLDRMEKLEKALVELQTEVKSLRAAEPNQPSTETPAP